MDSRELFGEMDEPVTIGEDEGVFEADSSAGFAEDMVSQEQEKIQSTDMTSEQIQQPVAEKSEKGNNSPAVIFATVLFVLVIGLCIYIAISVSNMIPQGRGKDKEYEAQTADPWEEILGEGYNEEQSEGQTKSDEEEYNDSYADDTYAYPNYAKDTFAGPYYEDVVDCIDYSVSYDVERKFHNIIEPENNVNIHTSYIRLDGDIPGIDEINRVLEEDATYFAENYKKGKEDMLETLEGKYKLDAAIRSYVTYNTENVISIVIREDILVSGLHLDVRLKCYNINIDTGMILDNASILDLEEDFGQEFRDRSNRQNGSGSADLFSDPEIVEKLTDKESVIFFYTPMGAELGYNYNESGYRGWITITMQDYEEYLHSV